MVPPCQVASTLRNEIEMHVERAAYSSEFRWCIESGYGPSTDMPIAVSESLL